LVNSGEGLGAGLQLAVKDNNETNGLTFYPPEYLREIKKIPDFSSLLDSKV